MILVADGAQIFCALNLIVQGRHLNHVVRFDAGAGNVDRPLLHELAVALDHGITVAFLFADDARQHQQDRHQDERRPCQRHVAEGQPLCLVGFRYGPAQQGGGFGGVRIVGIGFGRVRRCRRQGRVKVPFVFRLPELQEDGGRHQGEDAAADIGHGVKDDAFEVLVESSKDVLKHGERAAGDEQGRPNREGLLP